MIPSLSLYLKAVINIRNETMIVNKKTNRSKTQYLRALATST